MKPHLTLSLGVCATLLLACHNPPAAPAGGGTPDIILLMADDQGYGDLGLRHERLRTPNLDRLAREGVHFTRFYAAAPVCSPTRASCLTGRHPSRMGIKGANSGHLKAEEHNLARLLAARGYATGHFGKWHLGTLTKTRQDSNRGGRARHAAHFAPPWERGFQRCFSTEAKVPTYDPMITPPRWAGGVARNQQEGEPYGTAYWNERGEVVDAGLRGDNSKLIMDRVLPFLRANRAAGRPSFAVIWFHAPHLPVVGPPEWLARYADVADRQTRHYYACISALDEQVGRLCADLRGAGRFDNTLMLYCSDNGPEGRSGQAPGSAQGLRGRKRSLYEGGVRVPAMLSWPARIRGPRQIDQPCCTSDILPTVLGYLGALDEVAGRPLDGIDLAPLLEGRSARRGRGIGFASRRQAVWMEDRFKLVRRGQRVELFDIQADPSEQRDLGEGEAARRQRMLEALEVWLASCTRSASGADY